MNAPNDSRPAWRWLIAIAVSQILAHVLTNGRYGMFRDEFYYLACADHLAWGYVDHPPFSIAVLKVWKTVFGDSVDSVRLLPALAGGMATLLGGLIAHQLGGGRGAQILAALCVALAPVYLGLTGIYSMNGFDLLVWAATAYLLVRWINTGNDRLWLAIGAVLGIGLLNKISVLYLGVALVGALLLTPERRVLKSRALWIGGGIAVVVFLPHVVWQVTNGWPTLEFIENAKSGKITALSPISFFGEQVMQMNPVFATVWLTGLGYVLLAPRMARYRVLGLIYLLAFVILAAQRSKPYYLAAAYVPLFAAGGVAIEQVTRRARWILPIVVANVVVFGVAIAPLAIPVLPVERFVAYQAKLGMAPGTDENHEMGVLPQFFADRFGWREMTETVMGVYDALPESEKRECAILCGNYGEAGAILYYGRGRDLPPVISQHNNFYLWGPGERSGEVLIVVGVPEVALRHSFAEVEQVARVRNEYAMLYETNMPVYLARKLTQPIVTAWEGGKHYQ